MRKFPFIKQHDIMQCGIASLAMICDFYGQKYSLNYLSKFCFATNEGVSLMGISDAATKIGFKAYAMRLNIEQLKVAILPCILHWNQTHFVVLYKIKNKKYYIADPSIGLLKLSNEEFKKHWLSIQSNNNEQGIALLLEKNVNFGKLVEDKVNHKTFHFLFGYIRQYRKYFIQIIIALLFSCLLQLIFPFLTQSIVDIGISNKDINFIWLILLGELMIILGRTATDFIRRWLILHISMRINISLVSDFFIKLLKLPMSFFDTKQMGDLLQRMGDHSRVQSFLTTQILNIMFIVLSFMIFGIVLLIYNKFIFLIFLLFSFLYGIWISFFLYKRKQLDYELFEQQARNHNKTYQFITSMQEIKLQNCERRRRWEWEDVQADLFLTQMKSLKLQQTQEAGSVFINEVKNILITMLAATSVINGQMTLGMMLAIQYIIGQLNSPIEQFMNFIYSFQDLKISLERINEIHILSNEENSDNKICSFENQIRCITINKINFKYDLHALKNTLTDITFKIPTGKVTAIVGSSGSGKTTIIKLILGYYQVLTGEIFVAENNLNDFNLKWFRQNCGVVMQDGVIFSESIARNIAVNDDDIDILRLEKSAKLANIHDYICELPLKYDTQIGKDGIGLSQGQKQRILIARAVYKNPDYIFLDEATNALDAENERTIVNNLSEFYEGRTVVIVAHRLSTVKNADQIIVINKGEIAEIGNHASLIEKRGAYFNLVKNQLELGD